MKKQLDIKRLVLLNLPYVFAFYFVDKLASVFRLAPGAEFVDKLTGGFANIGTAFANPLPSFNPIDLFIGVAAGALLLFPGSQYVDKYITNPPDDYTVNPAYLSDEKFATLLTEAEKYLGYPYVWGGSNPSTSFDCSGFVSYVLTNSGLVNTGRLGAQGLYNVCTPVSNSDAQPGDLVFFVGTYDTPGVSHVGIYVGDGVMLHCGDPIQYSSINTSYWQSHFYAFGRPAY